MVLWVIVLLLLFILSSKDGKVIIDFSNLGTKFDNIEDFESWIEDEFMINIEELYKSDDKLLQCKEEIEKR